MPTQIGAKGSVVKVDTGNGLTVKVFVANVPAVHPFGSVYLTEIFLVPEVSHVTVTELLDELIFPEVIL